MSNQDDWKYAAALLILGGAAFGLVKCNGCGAPGSYSNGQRSGTIVKLSQKGLIFKTWEGELAAGAMSVTIGKSGTNAVPVVFEFSVSDPQVIETMLSAMESGEPVTIEYGQPYVMSWRDGSSGTMVTAVKPHKEKQ